MTGGIVPSGAGFGAVEPDPMEYVDPSVRREARRRWAVRAVEWRAVVLAEAVFGGSVLPRLVSGQPGRGFRAILELEVPFDDLERHGAAEVAFLEAARRDELLGGIPLVVLFAPRPREVATR